MMAEIHQIETEAEANRFENASRYPKEV